MTEEKPTWIKNKQDYTKEYLRQHSKGITFRLFYANHDDAELLKVYDSIPNKAEWFRECLRKYDKGE
mgnify:CR=1